MNYQSFSLIDLPNEISILIELPFDMAGNDVVEVTQAYGGSTSHFGSLYYSLDFSSITRQLPGLPNAQVVLDADNILTSQTEMAYGDGRYVGEPDRVGALDYHNFGNFITFEGGGVYATLMHLENGSVSDYIDGTTNFLTTSNTGGDWGNHVHVSYGADIIQPFGSWVTIADASEGTGRSVVKFDTALGILREGAVTFGSFGILANSNQAVDFLADGQPIEHNVFLMGSQDGTSAFGDNFDNILSGNRGDNTIAGLGGADAIWGGGGNDEIYGEGDNTDTDNDTVSPGDTIFGGGGKDTIYGGSQGDWIHGDSGEYRLWLTLASSFDRSYGLLHLSTFDDRVVTGGPIDFRYESPLAAVADVGDDLRGDSGNDTIFGGAGNDTIYGGTGNDIIFGGEDNDALFGEQGNDIFIGGSGVDTAYFESLSQVGVSFSFTRSVVDGLERVEVEQTSTALSFGAQDNGTDILYGVETISFGGTVFYDVARLPDTLNFVDLPIDFPGIHSQSTTAFASVDSDPIWINIANAEEGYELTAPIAGSSSSLAMVGMTSGNRIDFHSDQVYATVDGVTYQTLQSALTPTVANPDDHGDTRGTATLVSDLDGTAVRGEIGVSGDEDYFRFDTQSGRIYAVVATPDYSGVDPEIRVYNASGQLMASNADLGGGPSAGLSFTANGGTFYVEISGENGTTGDYGIGVSLIGDGSGETAPSDASEPDAGIDTTTRTVTHEGDEGDNTWLFSSSSSTEVFIAMYGGDDRAITGQRDDIVLGGAGEDTIETNAGNDTIGGGDDDDTIEGGDGNDGIAGGRDNDSIKGDDGDDTIAGEHGRDTLRGGDDDDVISGGDDDDRIDGDAGHDGILGDDGDDDIDGGTGNDTIYGGDDNDTIDGESGGDVLYGGRGRDFIWGGEDADRIDGGDGDDELLGEDGNDNISGGADDDTIRPGAGDDIIDGDGGRDTLSYKAMNGGATIDMTTERAYGAEIGFDIFDSMDHIIGTNGNDLIIGDGDDNQLYGLSGQDTITGGAGNDEIDGGSSTDTAVFFGNRADYTITASTNPDFDLQIIDNRTGSPDGTDLLNSIAFLQFADVSIRDDDALSSAPIAIDDSFEVSSDAPAILDVLANDTDPDGNTLSVSEIVSQPASGLAYIVNNRIVFDPKAEFTGENEEAVNLIYQISDGTGWIDEATVALVVDKKPNIDLALADWTMTSIDLEEMFPGEAGTFYLTLGNYGTDSAPAGNHVSIVLSSDRDVSHDDIILTSVAFGALAGGGQETVNSLQFTIPTSIVPGTYNIGYVVDINDAISETNESNNVTWLNHSTEIVARESLPDVSASNLNVVMRTDGSKLFDARFEVTNNGPDLPYGTAVALRLSEDQTIYWEGDYFLGSVGTGELAYGETVQLEISGVDLDWVRNYGTFNPGTHYFAVEADYSNSLAESDEQNNISNLVPIALAPPGIGGDVFAETGTLTMSQNTQSVTLHRSYINPVVVAFVATENGSQPVNVRVSDVSSNELTLQLQEPNYLDGSHFNETVNYMVVEAGSWVLPDGTLIEAGTLNSNQLSSQGFENVAFDSEFDSKPIILSQVQSFNGSDFVTTRQRNADADGFQVTMQEEEAGNSGSHFSESLGWVAIEAGSGSTGGIEWLAGRFSGVNDATTTVPLGATLAGGANVIAGVSSYAGSDPAWARGNGSTATSFDVSVEEDGSDDPETEHVPEQIDYFAFDGTGTLSAARLQHLLETGTLSLSTTQQTVNLQRSYENPVVVAFVATENGNQPVNVRVIDVSGSSLTMQLQEPNYLDGSHFNETVNYMVVEAGSWVLPDGTILEAGTLDSSRLSSQGFNAVSFDAEFETAPVILSQVQTFNGGDFVTTRQRNADADGFQLTMQEEEANNDGAHFVETLGWVAIEPGSGTAGGIDWLAGRSSGVTDATATVSLASAMSGVANVIAGVSSYVGNDPAWARGSGSSPNSFNVSVEEDTSQDSETEHLPETVDYFAFDGAGTLLATRLVNLLDNDDVIRVGDGPDNLSGGRGNDTIRSGDGNDTIEGGSGEDDLRGGDGDDVINGGSFADTIRAGSGNDTVAGGDGLDVVYLQAGNDVFNDNAQNNQFGHDLVYGWTGQDTILARGGNDTIWAGQDADSVEGGIGDDQIHGGSHGDTIKAGGGDDTVWGDDGPDVIYLQAGADTFIDNDQEGAFGQDLVYGWIGQDTILAKGGNDTIWAGQDADSVEGGIGDDQIHGGSFGDTIKAGGGDDTVWGDDGPDVIYLQAGADTFIDNDQEGAFGQDLIYGWTGQDTILAKGGNDTIWAGQDADSVEGGIGDDQIHGGSYGDTIK
ncbi:Ig-like domain-containing protein, partial [Lutimaribacter marinistellae]